MRVEVIKATESPEELVWRAARQCYVPGFILDRDLPDNYNKLITDLLNRGHYGPFEHPQISFNIGGISRACLAQLTRHRIGVTFDVQSHRYTTVTEGVENNNLDDCFVYPPYLESGATSHARGYGKIELTDDEQAYVEGIFTDAYAKALDNYFRLLEVVPAEDARLVLPEGVKVNLVMSCNARSLMHILDLRLPPNAQWEIRMLCGWLLDLAEEWMPTTFRWYREKRAGKHKLAP